MIAASFHIRLSGSSEQTGDPAVFVHVDLLGSGDLGQTRHGHDLARQGNDEARTGACLLYTSPSPRDMRRSRMPSSA